MRRFGRLLGSALLVAGCFGGPPSPAPSATAAAETPAPSPTATAMPAARPTLTPTAVPEPTPEPTVTTDGCPTGPDLTIALYVDSDLGCLGSTDVELRGWLDEVGIGFLPPGIKPSWLWVPGSSDVPALWQTRWAASDGGCEGSDCGVMLLHVDPSSDVVLDGAPRWVIVTGHRDDPKATRCHYVYPEDWPGEPLDDATAVATCRQSFVLTSIRDAP